MRNQEIYDKLAGMIEFVAGLRGSIAIILMSVQVSMRFGGKF